VYEKKSVYAYVAFFNVSVYGKKSVYAYVAFFNVSVHGKKKCVCASVLAAGQPMHTHLRTQD